MTLPAPSGDALHEHADEAGERRSVTILEGSPGEAVDVGFPLESHANRVVDVLDLATPLEARLQTPSLTEFLSEAVLDDVLTLLEFFLGHGAIVAGTKWTRGTDKPPKPLPYPHPREALHSPVEPHSSSSSLQGAWKGGLWLLLQSNESHRYYQLHPAKQPPVTVEVP